ncbi:hypothetical protein AAKU67_001867 [Oxalobacteraceae bacterium GrIS 2.11]
MEQGLYNNKTMSTLGDDTQHIVTVDKVPANLYFDGTLNNYYNVEKADEATRKEYGGEGTSYANALSNVARMWKAIGLVITGTDIGVYIEGMGTTKYEKDSMKGYALGEGETGIRARAQSAFGPLMDSVKASRGKAGPPALLELNIFGFSRGAATARHFVHLLRDEHEIAKHFTDQWSHVQVVVNFVGLFDTVSAEGINHRNDVNDLGLRFTDESARHVFHLVALDEYRSNFSDTTIASARNATVVYDNHYKPMGFELGMPGAHSDVGGGYLCDVNQGEIEQRHLAPAVVADSVKGTGELYGPQAFVYQQGFYRAADMKATPWQPYFHQRTVTGDYYKVALSLMVDMAEKFTVTTYQSRLDMLAREPAIAALQTSLRQLVQDNAFHAGKPTRIDWELNTQLGLERAREFRRAYLHLSANHAKFGMEPRYRDLLTWERHHEAG